jgi:hypothetical protein
MRKSIKCKESKREKRRKKWGRRKKKGSVIFLGM